jgi:uncharacterized delta-60 repeat protein
MIAALRKMTARNRKLAFALALIAALPAPALAQARPGDLDRSFGGDGKVTTRIAHGFRSGAASVVIDPRGRIVVAGSIGMSHFSEFALARYKRNGRLDRSFSGDGKATTEFRVGASGATSVGIDPRGRIVAAGARCIDYPDCDFAIARYKPNGTRDRSFSGNGKATTHFEEGALAKSVAIDPRGRVVAAGLVLDGTPHFALARYRWNGGLDPSFGYGGKLTTDFPGGSDYANSVAIDSGARIVAAGLSTDLPGTAFALARYEPNGDLDPSFGFGGTMTTRCGGVGIAYSVAIDSQGRIVAAGGTTQANGEFALARYEPNGGLDPPFGSGGKVTTHFRTEGIANSVAIDSRDRIVAAGARCIDYPDCDFAIARYKPNGSLDRSFSRNGKVTKPKDGANSVAIDSRDRIVAAGSHRGRFVVARYIGYRRP